MINRKSDQAPKLTAAEAIRRRRTAVGLRRGYLSLLGRILLIILIAYLMLTQVFLLTQAQGNGMFPAVKDGDLLIAYRLEKEFLKDDVVVYTLNGEICVGRVAARETDVVTVNDSGSLLVNGTVQTGEILYPTYAKDGITYPYTVPEGHVFILGDYRTQTEDSRDHGAIPVEDIQAKLITILRRQGI